MLLLVPPLLVFILGLEVLYCIHEFFQARVWGEVRGSRWDLRTHFW